MTVSHLNSLNCDNYQFWVSLPYSFLENNFRVQVLAYLADKYQDLSVQLLQDLGITYMLFRMPSEDLHIAAKFHPGLSRLRESRCSALPSELFKVRTTILVE